MAICEMCRAGGAVPKVARLDGSWPASSDFLAEARSFPSRCRSSNHFEAARPAEIFNQYSTPFHNNCDPCENAGGLRVSVEATNRRDEVLRASAETRSLPPSARPNVATTDHPRDLRRFFSTHTFPRRAQNLGYAVVSPPLKRRAPISRAMSAVTLEDANGTVGISSIH